MGRERYDLPDGRYLEQVAPSVFCLRDTFGFLIAQLDAESVTIDSTTDEEPCEYEQGPHGSDQAR